MEHSLIAMIDHDHIDFLNQIPTLYEAINNDLDSSWSYDEDFVSHRDPDSIHSIEWNLPGKVVCEFQRQ